MTINLDSERNEEQLTTYSFLSKKISNDQELIKSDPTSCPQNQKGNNFKTAINKYLSSMNKKLYLCFVDFSKAFDCIWRDGLLVKLLRHGVGGKFLWLC